MQIVKQLNLNKVPQAAINGSLVCSKNICLSPDAQYITDEEGVIDIATNNTPAPGRRRAPYVYEDASAFEGDIIGVIECPKEFIVFTREVSISQVVGHVYRVKEVGNDNVSIKEIDLNWTPRTDTTVRGCYIYNANGDLIVAIAEYAENLEGDGVPLKVINLDTKEAPEHINNNTSDINPPVPICNCKCLYKQLGTPIPQGLYTFFVRYEIDKNNYTNWFPIGVPYYAYSTNLRKVNTHTWRDEEDDTHYNDVKIFINDVSEDCPYNFVLSLDFDEIFDYKAFQIGYILQHESATVGRMWHKFSIESKHVTITFDATNAEEISIDELIAPVLQITNVKTLTTFENRIYIGNFKEVSANTINEEIETAVNGITAKVVVSDIDPPYLKDVTNWDYTRTISNATTYTLTTGSLSASIINTTAMLFTYRQYISNLKTLLAAVTNIGGTPVSADSFEDVDNVWFATVTVTPDSRTIINPVPADYIDFNLVLATTSLTPVPLSVFVTSNPYIPAGIHDTLYVCFGSPSTNINQWKLVQFNQISVAATTAEDAINYTNKYTDLMEIPSLDRNEVYSFYVHFVRRDGTYTNGYKVNSNTYVPTEWYDKYNSGKLRGLYKYIAGVESVVSGDHSFLSFKNNENDQLYKTYWGAGEQFVKQEVLFENVQIPTGFVGAFFSYEKVEPLVCFTGIVTKLGAEQGLEVNKSICVTSLDTQVALTAFKGAIIYPVTGGGEPCLILDADIYIGNHEGNGEMPYIKLLLDDYNYSSFEVNNIVQILRYTDNMYTQENKTLIPFGPILTANSNTTVYSSNRGAVAGYDFNYPSFFVAEPSIRYNGVYISDVDKRPYSRTVSSGIDKDPMTSSYATLQYYYKFSRYNLNALSFKKEPQYVLVVDELNTDNPLISKPAFSGYVVKPEDGADLFELQAMFLRQSIKAYTNYNNNYDDVQFTNVIRRSNVLSDESSRNTWRTFDANDYKLVPKDKGAITNIVALGNTLFIHLEHTLYMAIAQAALDNNYQTKYYKEAYNSTKSINISNPDIFDLDLQELFSSNHGFGGLQDGDAWCINHAGYWFYDNDNNRLYNLDNGKLNDINVDITAFLKYSKPDRCRFATDFKRDRLLIAFKYEDTYYATLSFSLLTARYISLHDYTFDIKVNTKYNCYLANRESYIVADTNKLFTFNSEVPSGYYAGLKITNQHFPKYENVVNGVSKCAAYFDVIFLDNYELPKVLESVKYIVSKIASYCGTTDNRASEHYTGFNTLEVDSWNKEYSGDRLLIYTDCTNSGILNIDGYGTNGKTNLLYNSNSDFTDYKFPYYNKGVWQLNYFRNLINDANLASFVAQVKNKLSNQLYGQQYNALNAKQKEDIDTRVQNFDQLSLIYGKYFVLRFIFNNIETGCKLKFENLTLTYNGY